MIEIATRPPDRQVHEPGLRLMREIVSRRLAMIETEERDGFSQGSVDELIRASGGQPRELMHLVRRAIISGGIPVTLDHGVQTVKTEAKRALRRGLSVAHERILAQVTEDGALLRTAENEGAIRELLENRMLLHYINDEGWYAPNPLL